MMGNVLLLEDGDYGAAVLLRKIGEKNLVVPVARPKRRADQDGDDGGDRCRQYHLLAALQATECLAQAVDDADGRRRPRSGFGRCCHLAWNQSV
jgi:hypothetical protein